MTVLDPASKSMDDLVSLCKRRGFVYPASEIYGGLNGFWDYGPLGTTLKNRIRDWWWKHMVDTPPIGPDGEPVSIVGVDTAIIQNPKVWEASGHVGGFNDPMVDDTETKQRARADHLFGFFAINTLERTVSDAADDIRNQIDNWTKESLFGPSMTCISTNADEALGVFTARLDELERRSKRWKLLKRHDELGQTLEYWYNNGELECTMVGVVLPVPWDMLEQQPGYIPSPFPGDVKAVDKKYFRKAVLTKPKQFNLMFETYVGAVFNEENKAYLRPETAQGIFLNYKNVLDTMRVKVPFGIAQIGKSFRNEVTPRNYIFRSREFEQMEMEFFCPPEESQKWYDFWKHERMRWWESLGINKENLRFRDHDDDELAHYSNACVDVEYKYPFTAPGFGELEGVAHRGCYDLTQHQTHSGQKMDYFDQELQVKLQNEGLDKETIKERSKYIPHVIEPASGLTRAVLVLLCEAYTPDESRPSKVYMKFDPKFAPYQAAVFPLVAKDGMPEKAEGLYNQLRGKYAVQMDVKQNIGKRYARMDEAGCPFCITIDGDTMQDDTVTIRHRDTLEQTRVNIDKVEAFLTEQMG